MRIKIINPNTTQAMTDDIYDAAMRVKNPDTEIVAVTPKRGPASIENMTDEFVSTIGVMEEVYKGMEEGFDAYIVACYGDPGLYACREIADVPVVGIAEASMYMASMVAPKFSVVAVIPRTTFMLTEVVKRYSMQDKCVSIRDSGMSVLGFGADPEEGKKRLKEAAIKAIEEDGAEAICLGCAGMVTFTEALEKELGVPVFDGVTAAVKMAESLVQLGKKTSKKLYFSKPELKEYINFDYVAPR